MSAPLLVVDAPFVLYRSFFGVPTSVRGADGHPVNALLGSVNLLLRALDELAPRALVTCFGAEQAAYRVALYPGYHAQREPMPAALAWQFAQAPPLFGALGWQVETSVELEADDLLGAYALSEAAAGGQTLILTGDRDLYQCVSPYSRLVFVRPGVAAFQLVDVAEVERRYGVSPPQVPDFIALRGDPSDGLPGAPGVGAKTAAALLERHGSLEALLSTVASGDAGERPRLAAALREHAELLRAFREIAQLRTPRLTRPPISETDLSRGAVAAAALGMNQLAGRLRGQAEQAR